MTTKQRVAGTGTPSFGYIGSGYSPSCSSISTVDRIDFSNDTSTALSRGSLTTSKYDNHAATNARNFGNPILGPSVVENFATHQDSHSHHILDTIPKDLWVH